MAIADTAVSVAVTTLTCCERIEHHLAVDCADWTQCSRALPECIKHLAFAMFAQSALIHTYMNLSPLPAMVIEATFARGPRLAHRTHTHTHTHTLS